MRYSAKPRRHRWPRRLTIILLVGLLIIGGATVAMRRVYNQKLQPVSNNQTTQLVTVGEGSTVDAIGQQLEKDGLIQSAWAFKLYVSTKQLRSNLQAGTYALSPSLSVSDIVTKLTSGKIATDNITILPGQRLDQIKASLINSGFKPEDVEAALKASTYVSNPALVDKPAEASLEGYIFPDSFQKNSGTNATLIVEKSLAEMQAALTPDIRAAFAKQGLSTYQGIVLASIVEKEVSKPVDRQQVAQVFLSRLRQDMMLGSDVTAFYGSILDGKEPSVNYDSPYNTRKHKGLPPTPISNVSLGSLKAVAYPANTDWLFFVSGDDGTTHFSKTLEEHDALSKQYCHKLCE
jgi:UPF0755 protein